MSLLVVGSVAFDSVKTPYGSVDRVLAGAGTYFALAASFFTDVRVVAVVGEDFTATEEKVFLNRGIDITGIAHAKGKSFFWAGEYGENVNEAKTLDTQLGVFADFNPQIPAKFKKTEYVFLANIDPVLQVNVRKQVDGAKFVGGDTMNYWINGSRPQLAEMLALSGIFVLEKRPTERMPPTPLWNVTRARAYGATEVLFLQRAGIPAEVRVR